MNLNDTVEQIRKIILDETKYMRTYDAKVLSVTSKKVKCAIPALGWNTENQGALCVSIQNQGLIDLKKDDYIVVGFRNNNPAQGYIIGMANNYNGMAPTTYNFENKIETLYEDRDSNVQITKDGTQKQLKEFVKSGWKIILENGDGQKIELNASQIKFNDGTESFMLGDTWKTNWNAMAATIAGATSGTTAQNASGIETIKTAVATFNANISSILSTIIKGK